MNTITTKHALKRFSVISKNSSYGEFIHVNNKRLLVTDGHALAVREEDPNFYYIDNCVIPPILKDIKNKESVTSFFNDCSQEDKANTDIYMVEEIVKSVEDKEFDDVGVFDLNCLKKLVDSLVESNQENVTLSFRKDKGMGHRCMLKLTGDGGDVKEYSFMMSNRV